MAFTLENNFNVYWCVRGEMIKSKQPYPTLLDMRRILFFCKPNLTFWLGLKNVRYTREIYRRIKETLAQHLTRYFYVIQSDFMWILLSAKLGSVLIISFGSSVAAENVFFYKLPYLWWCNTKVVVIAKSGLWS